MKNKKGMSPGVMVVLILAILAIAGVLTWQLGAFDGVSQQVTGQELAKACGDPSNPLTVSAISALAQGTAVGSPTITCGVDGNPVATSVTSGTTEFTAGNMVKCLISKADYLDEEFEFEMPCGAKTLSAPLYYSTSDNPVIRVINDEGDYVADSSNAVVHSGINQTAVSAGETLKVDIELGGTSLESTGDGVLVIEFPASTSANISKVELSGASSTSVPTVHSSVNAGSKIVAFDIPAVVGSGKAIHTLTIELGTGDTLVGSTLMDWYAKQKFVDDDGTIQYGVEDSDGTAKYENTLDFDWRTEETGGE